MKSMNQEDFATEFNPLFTISSNKSLLDNELKIYKSENKQLQQELNKLKEQLASKDKLLDSKSKHNLRLKQQNESLKKKLKKNKRNNGKNKKKLSHVQSKNKGKKKNNSDTNVDNKFINDDNEMPYVIPRISTSISASSNLSAQAVSLSFPNTTQIDTNHKSNQSTINMLSPIAESSNNSDNMPIDVQISNNNNNIHIDEWKESIATIEGHIATNNIKLQCDQFDDSHSDVSNASNKTDKLLEQNRNRSKTIFSDDMVSYMTDNTMLLLDMHYIELHKKSPTITAHNDAIIKPPFELLNSQTIYNL